MDLLVDRVTSNNIQLESRTFIHFLNLLEFKLKRNEDSDIKCLVKVLSPLTTFSPSHFPLTAARSSIEASLYFLQQSQIDSSFICEVFLGLLIILRNIDEKINYNTYLKSVSTRVPLSPQSLVYLKKLNSSNNCFFSTIAQVTLWDWVLLDSGLKLLPQNEAEEALEYWSESASTEDQISSVLCLIEKKASIEDGLKLLLSINDALIKLNYPTHLTDKFLNIVTKCSNKTLVNVIPSWISSGYSVAIIKHCDSFIKSHEDSESRDLFNQIQQIFRVYITFFHICGPKKICESLAKLIKAFPSSICADNIISFESLLSRLDFTPEVQQLWNSLCSSVVTKNEEFLEHILNINSFKSWKLDSSLRIFYDPQSEFFLGKGSSWLATMQRLLDYLIAECDTFKHDSKIKEEISLISVNLSSAIRSSFDKNNVLSRDTSPVRTKFSSVISLFVSSCAFLVKCNLRKWDYYFNEFSLTSRWIITSAFPEALRIPSKFLVETLRKLGKGNLEMKYMSYFITVLLNEAINSSLETTRELLSLMNDIFALNYLRGGHGSIQKNLLDHDNNWIKMKESLIAKLPDRLLLLRSDVKNQSLVLDIVIATFVLYSSWNISSLQHILIAATESHAYTNMFIIELARILLYSTPGSPLLDLFDTYLFTMCLLSNIGDAICNADAYPCDERTAQFLLNRVTSIIVASQSNINSLCDNPFLKQLVYACLRSMTGELMKQYLDDFLCYFLESPIFGDLLPFRLLIVSVCSVAPNLAGILPINLLMGILGYCNVTSDIILTSIPLEDRSVMFMLKYMPVTFETPRLFLRVLKMCQCQVSIDSMLQILEVWKSSYISDRTEPITDDDLFNLQVIIESEGLFI